ncbi:hypothetical protein [Nonomuraea sp. MG754425]|uniref:hypothetical protein n=1 Tax=Nonomuraea sp. MG754425 TaxID=2570319 RepID=UPI001F1F1759|nr:hypothetical protein [Nonomuraea sp. MG754425]
MRREVVQHRELRVEQPVIRDGGTAPSRAKRLPSWSTLEPPPCGHTMTGRPGL